MLGVRANPELFPSGTVFYVLLVGTCWHILSWSRIKHLFLGDIVVYGVIQNAGIKVMRMEAKR